MQHLARSFFFIFFLALTLVGCGSSVKLNDVPVENRVARPANSQTDATAGASQQATTTPSNAGLNRLAVSGPLSRLIFFDYESFVIQPEFQNLLEKHAQFLASQPMQKITLEGHTDERGGREYNLALGQQRAEAVRRALAVLGVNAAQMEAVSFGKEKPAEPGSSEEAFAKNRRVEIRYL